MVVRWARVDGGQIDRPLKARVAVYDQDGARIAQTDQRILNDRHLLASEWSMEDTPLNVYMLDLPDELPSGQYTLRLLVYDAETLEPLALVNPPDPAFGLEAELGTLQIVEQD